MPQLVKTWSTWDNSVTGENLADAGTTANITYARDATDVAAKFTTATANQTNVTENARVVTGDTWEAWGVPAGQVVIGIQITACKKKVVAATNLTATQLIVGVLDASNVAVSQGNLTAYSCGTTVDGAYVELGASGAKPVFAASQASTTVVKLNLAFKLSTGTGTTTRDVRFDDLALTIIYGMFLEDDADPVSGLYLPRKVYRKRRNVVIYS